MSIVQFLRILWAYRMLTLLTIVATVIGAAVAILIVPPRYEASTRVMLNTLKPDPVTGQIPPSGQTREYLATQIELVKDFGVAGQAVESLGWLTNPDYLQAYNSIKNPDGDMRRWLAQQIIDRTKVNPVVGTNILTISFQSRTPAEARSMTNALRDAYVDSTLATRRRDAMRNAEWFTQQATREKELLDAADTAKTAYEKEIGIVMEDDKTDIETARLRSLAAQSTLGAQIMAPTVAATASPASIELAQMDAQIAQAMKTLGPNHPALVAIRARRATLAKVVQDDQAAARDVTANQARALGAGSGALNRAVAEQTARVIANRSKIQHLNQLQGEVNLHREQMEKSLARAVMLRQEAAVADPGITVLSEAVTPTSPAFPKKGLILGGAIALGGAAGLLLSLILEFLFRRIRGVEDLEGSISVPLLAVIGPLTPSQRERPASFLQRFSRRNRRVTQPA
ncbi:Wzz/FepE/Etk N-terminal domain-containing protein [Phenylobacterium sp.]|uniref:Wzz/FepE/Etk N-terminal domain-containing protein n=1 Tax=Phenylobacterium sp. TaxID=1871053 RepID=UPI00374CCBC8